MDKKYISKCIISIFNLVICTYIVSICLICLIEFDTWREKAIAIIITLGSAYIFTLILNRFLPTKIRILGGIFDLLSGPLLIIGSIMCLALFDPWPIKILGMLLWIILMFCLPSFVNLDKE